VLKFTIFAELSKQTGAPFAGGKGKSRQNACVTAKEKTEDTDARATKICLLRVDVFVYRFIFRWYSADQNGYEPPAIPAIIAVSSEATPDWMKWMYP
jgi:hypothetical protein